MRLVKVPASNLRPGMFVAEVDRPWLETPFALQGFVVRDPGDVQYISKYVDHVFVDVEYVGAATHLPWTTADLGDSGKEGLQLKADFQQASVSYDSAADTLEKVFDSMRRERQTDLNAVKDAVRPLIDGVFRNQEAVAALLRLKEAGDYRYDHGISMALWAAILGRHLGLHRQELEKLAVGCAMCDIGMTELPEQILNQTEALTQEQVLSVREHPKKGAQMVAESKDVDVEILAIIENHHERMDGSGYPRGLQGAAIPLLARIAGLVDTYDAMISAQPYSAARTSHDAVQELIDCKGTRFQDALVEQFVQAIGLFPTGSLVELCNGEVAIVVSQNNSRRLKPEVVIVLDANKNRKTVPDIVDLAQQNNDAGGGRWIARELLPGDFGVNSEDFFI